MLSNVPGLNLLDVSTPSPSGDNQKHLQTGPQATRGTKSLPVENHCSEACIPTSARPQMSKYTTLPTPPTEQVIFILPLIMHACVQSHFSHDRLSAIPRTVAHQLLYLWDSPDRNTGVGCHVLL